jgi:hypothetical protein
VSSETTFTSVDPGGECLAWAHWTDGALTAVGLSRTKVKGWQARARHHREFLTARGTYTRPVLTECMRVRGGRGLGNPQILVELNGIAGHVGTDWVEPGTWKGRVPKEDHQPLIWDALMPAERLLLESVMPAGLRHNAVDAVGIGLYKLGRLVPTSKPSKPRPKTEAPKVKKKTNRARKANKKRKAAFKMPRKEAA